MAAGIRGDNGQDVGEHLDLGAEEEAVDQEAVALDLGLAQPEHGVLQPDVAAVSVGRNLVHGPGCQKNPML